MTPPVPLWPATLAGLACAPVGALAGLAVAYGILTWRGVSEMEGRRGFLAGFYGIVPGIVLGFWAGFAIVRRLQTQYAERRAMVAGAAAGLLAAVCLFVPGWIAGIRWAENRGASNYAGERAAWGLFYVALPLGVAGGIGGFMLGYVVMGAG